MQPGGQLRLDGTPCTVQVPEALSELGSCLADLQEDGVLELISEQLRMHEMLFGGPAVAITPIKGHHYLVVRCCRAYLLWYALNPSPRNPLTVLILPKLTSAEIAPLIALETVGEPLLYLLFNERQTKSSTHEARKRHRGNLQWTLNDAIENVRILDRPICEFLSLSRNDLERLGVELDYYRNNHQPEESREKVDTTPSEAKSNQGDGLNAEVPHDPTPGPESVQDETPDAKSTVNSSNVDDLPATSDKDSTLETGVAPNQTQPYETTRTEHSEITITEPAALAGALTGSEPAPPALQESQTSNSDRQSLNSEPDYRCHTN